MIRPALNSLITGFAMPACVAGSDSVGPDISVTDAPNVAVSQTNLLAGTTDGALGGNGLAFAAADDTIDTLVGKPITVKMVRFHRDRDTMKVTVLVSQETVTLNEDFYNRI